MLLFFFSYQVSVCIEQFVFRSISLTLLSLTLYPAPAKVRRVSVTKADSTWLTVDWGAVGPDQCCGFVVNYTVFYRDSNGPELSKSEICAIGRLLAFNH